MTVAALLSSLHARGIGIRAEGEELRVRAPHGALTSEEVRLLREHRSELLAALRRSGRWGLRLSGQQERLWYLDRVEPGLTTYVLPAALRLEGPLRVDVLKEALRDFIDRHDLGRVHIRTEAERPELAFASESLLSFEELDAADVLRDPADPAELLEWVADASNMPLRLDEPPLIRFKLLRLDAGTHVLIVAVHHAIFDGWGFDILLREVGACYAARLERRAPALPPLAGSYADYVIAQQERITGPRAEASERFWTEALAGPLPDLELVGDRSRPPQLTYAGRRVNFTLPGTELARMRALATDAHATVFLVLLTAYTALLHRMTGQQDIIVGVPVSGRNDPRFDDVVGFFVNTVVMRAKPETGMTFRELLRHVGGRFIAAIDHQETPFEWIARRFARRDASRTPVVQTTLTHQYAADRTAAWGDVRLRSINHQARVATTDLGVWVREYHDRIEGGLDFRSDLFDDATAESMQRAFFALLTAGVRDPDRALEELPLLDAREAEAETVGRRGPRRDPASLGSFLSRIDEQVAAAPDAIAVEDERGVVRYGELRTRAAAVASALRAQGVAAGDPVIVLVERDRHLPVLLLGVMRAGAVYLPFDTNFPAERLRFMVADSGARRVIVDAETRDLAVQIGLTPVMKDDLMMAAADGSASIPESSAVAYRLYTSGSTGRPKSAVISHGALTNFLTGMQELLALTPADILLAVTTVSFDISLLELLLPLVTGGRVVVASSDETINAPALAERMRSTSVTVMQATPATWRLLLDGGWTGGLRIALSGGETLPRSLADGLLGRCGVLWNMYGPTETTVWSMARRVRTGAGRVPIGNPLLNTDVYVLDQRQHPVPQGMPGEIWIGGHGVALGYWRRDDLTSARFRHDPFAGTADARMYRTGDLGRWRADGALDFLGRSDAQVKVHGYRIELTEVEAVLESLPWIRQAAVDARGEDADRRLIGWVLFEEGLDDRPTSSELRRELRHRLPAFMVPAMLVPVSEMPLTLNGKIDRQRLPDSARAAAADRLEFAPPQGRMEEVIAQEWCRLLGVEQVGRNDNFFEVGGYSLLSLQAVGAIEQRTGRRIDPRRFFFSTLAQLAE